MIAINELDKQFSVGEQIRIIKGNNGIPFIWVRNKSAEAKLSLYGGQLLSYVPQGQRDLLFLSDVANYQTGGAIKGGIPVCWPWFGVDPQGKGRQSHGFARNRMWEIRSTESHSEQQSRVIMGLKEDAESLKLWPHVFDLSIEVIIGESLDVYLKTTNTGSEAFEVSQALHTYFSIDDLESVKLKGLDKKNYLDKAKSNTGEEEKIQAGDVEFNDEVDRIYLDVPASLQLHDVAAKRKVEINSAGNCTAVVWNPAAQLTKQMSDLRDTDYQHFVCVETANAADNIIRIQPGESFELSASYHVCDL